MAQRLENSFANAGQLDIRQIGGHVSTNFLRVKATGENSVGTNFSACKTGMDRMTVTSFIQSLSL